LQARLARTREASEREVHGVAQIRIEADAAEAELLGHQRAVAAQGISAEDAVRMSTEHAQLGQASRELERRVAEARAGTARLEVALANAAGRAEETVDAYADRLLGPGLEDTLGLELVTASATLSGPDIARTVRPTLHRGMEERQQARARVEGERIAGERALEQLRAECEAEEARLQALRRESERIAEEAEQIREVCTLAHVSYLTRSLTDGAAHGRGCGAERARGRTSPGAD
jgi:hypothetical protein